MQGLCLHLEVVLFISFESVVDSQRTVLYCVVACHFWFLSIINQLVKHLNSALYMLLP